MQASTRDPQGFLSHGLPIGLTNWTYRWGNGVRSIRLDLRIAKVLCGFEPNWDGKVLKGDTLIARILKVCIVAGF